jgi:hypothetical protein
MIDLASRDDCATGPLNTPIAPTGIGVPVAAGPEFAAWDDCEPEL